MLKKSCIIGFLVFEKKFSEILIWKNSLKITSGMDYFLVNDMQPPPPPLSNTAFFNFLVQNDTQCSGTNLKLILRFLVFELFLILFTILKCFYLTKKYEHLKICTIFWIGIFVFMTFFFVRFLDFKSHQENSRIKKIEFRILRIFF